MYICINHARTHMLVKNNKNVLLNIISECIATFSDLYFRLDIRMNLETAELIDETAGLKERRKKKNKNSFEHYLI